MKVLVPMAGPDDGFRDVFVFGKSLAEIEQRPLIEHVVENLSSIPDAAFVFVVRKEEARRFHLDSVLRLLSPTCVVVVAETQTSGAACTALLAIEHIDTDDPLVIANGDQIIDADLGKVLCDFRARDLDGGIIVFDAVHPRWSYVRVDEEGNVREAAEKRPISRHATAGFYYFRSGRTFVEAAKDMIRKDDQVNGAFYVCPVYNQMILRQAKVGIYTIPRNAYHSLATPRGVDAYHKLISGKETIAEI